jgi:hypothetical protein
MRRVSSYAVLTLSLCALATPGQSWADGIDDFILKDGLGNTITWKLPASPTPSVVSPDSFFFDLLNVPGTINGIAGETLNLAFVNQNAGGGLTVGTTADTIGIVGVVEGATFPQLYSGPEDAPTFLAGTFSFPVLTAIDELNQGVTAGTLTITPDVRTVPEPSTLTLLAATSLGMGAMLLGKSGSSNGQDGS